MTSCKKPAQPNPQRVYEEIQKRFLVGELSVAQIEAHRAREQFSTAGWEWDWKFRLLEAKALVWQGRNRDALSLLSEPLPESPPRPELAIQRDIDQALASARLGQLNMSSQALADAQRLNDQHPSSSSTELLCTEGILDMQRGDLQQSEFPFRKGLEQAKQQGDRFWAASILLNLGVVSLEEEHYDEALYWSHAASDMARTINAQLILEKSLANEGWAYYELGDYERSLTSSQQAVVNAEKLGSTVDQVRLFNNSGQALYQLHNLKEAQSVYERSLAIAESIQNQSGIERAHSAIAFLLLDEGEDDAARVHVNQALDVARSQGNKPDELVMLFARALIAIHKAEFGDAEAILKSIYASPALTPSFRWEIEDALANVSSKQNRSDLAEVWYRKAIDTFDRQRSSVRAVQNRLPFFGNADQLYRDYIEFLIQHGRSDQALQVLDEGRARTLREGLKENRDGGSRRKKHSESLFHSNSYGMAAKQIARSLGGTVLEFSLGEKRSYLWAITSTGIRLYELPVQAQIDSHVKEYERDILNSTDVLAKKDDAGIWLFEKLVAPAGSAIPKYGKVFVIPDGSLNRINFETLLVSDPAPHFWIEDVTLTSADSLQLLQTFRVHVPASPNPKLLLIGNPISAAADFAELPNASAEVNNVSAHFLPASRTVLTQGQASPVAYTNSHPEQYSYIHFVAHGVANHLSPLDSAVLLSRIPGRPDDFKLYARDIVHQPLHAELVTISTCLGSGTKSYSGEGLVGLSWAFLRAGSHNVIGALWAVSDASTPALMNDLYGNLEKGDQPDVALRSAKLSLAHSSGVYRKPLYWGAFQLYAGS